MNNINNEQGFSYIDVMIAIMIVMVGILGLTGALMVNLSRSFETDAQLKAKQHALSAIESIFSARSIAAPGSVEGWDSIGNVGSNPVNGVPKGIFLAGFTPIRVEEGPDGVLGTADDACAAGASCPSPGNPANASEVVKGFTRQIVITDVAGQPGKRKIEVTIKYAVRRTFREEKMATMITSYQ